MQNTHEDGWIGSITFGRDETGPYIAGSCPTCTGSGSTSLIQIKGNDDGDGHYNAQCLDGKMCGISLPVTWATTSLPPGQP